MSWASDIQAVHDEAGGVFELYVVATSEMPDIIAAMLLGSDVATRLLFAIRDTVASINQASRGKPALCVCCPRTLRGKRFMCGIVLPAREDARQAIGAGVCDRCATDATKAGPKVMEGLRSLWPDLRPVTISNHAAGHA